MDVTLHSTQTGTGEPLILLHGNGEDSTYFSHQTDCLSEAFRVIALDTRGHGRSTRGTAPFTLDQFAADLAAFMDSCEIAAAHLLGFSDGANIAMLFALAYPERVLSLVLNGGNLFPAGMTDEVRREDAVNYEAALASGDTRRLELLRLMMDEPNIDPAALSVLTMPTLVIAGTDDMIDEGHTRLIAKSIPGAELAFIEGSHFVAAENPAPFNDAIMAFYRRIMASRG